jgi:hypothetical protein
MNESGMKTFPGRRMNQRAGIVPLLADHDEGGWSQSIRRDVNDGPWLYGGDILQRVALENENEKGRTR